MPVGVYIRSKETKEKISNAVKKLWQNSDYREQMIQIAKESKRMPPSRKGVEMSKESKKKIGDFWRGKKRKPLSTETRKRISKSLMKYRDYSDKYRVLHEWVRRWKPKSLFCEKCGRLTDKLDASSIKHTYERDISKWRWLCRKCHIKVDRNGKEIEGK